ncbi:hypothetical protein DH09_11705 [Bacillaceae bacterium JMAK1]|nr:hypothetical protein DH09_11705 [Bacillaceae bacterium JMAK1]
MRNDKSIVEEYIYNQIKSAILTGKIPRKMQLNEEQLAEAFEVSRTPIRSVLKKLAYEKIVKSIPFKGSFVNLPEKKEIEETFHLRTLLETDAIKYACQNSSKEELDALEEFTKQEEQSYKDNKYDEGIQMTANFHHGLVCLTQNKVVEEINLDLINRSTIYLAYHDEDRESPSCPQDHREILQAIRDKNQPEAIRLCLLHFENIKTHLGLTNQAEIDDFSSIFKPMKTSN